MNKRYVLVTLGGCLMGLAVMLVVVLTSPSRDASGAELAGITIGVALLGGALTFVRNYAKDRAQAAGRAVRERREGGEH